MSKKSFLVGALGAAMLVLPAVPAQAAPAQAPATSSVAAVTTVYFSTAGAPSFRSVILAGVSHWNSSEANVQLVENPGAATLFYTEGNDPQGSYANTDGHGSGTIFIDYTQAQQYDQVRITAHETGHVLGLADDYSGPCSELMSGGGPGPSCTNSYPDANESYYVDYLWEYGLVGASRAPVRIYG